MAEIPLFRLVLPYLGAALLAAYYAGVTGERRLPWLAMLRMTLQLLAVGYVLGYLFSAQSFGLVFATLALMASFAAWIGLRTVPDKRRNLFPTALGSLVIGAGLPLAVAVLYVLRPEPWFDPAVWLPLGGMAFANGMNAISLAAERYFAGGGRAAALKAALIPATNSMLAVGVVSIPGVMTGQILAGVSPLVAARYQILVMLLVFQAAGFTAALFLSKLKSPSRSRGRA